MKVYTLASANYHNQASRKKAICLSITRGAGESWEETVRGTSWDQDLDLGGSPAEVYYSTSGGALSDVESTSALNVDNAEIRANFDAITSEDLQAGLWNGAEVDCFVVNPDALSDGRMDTLFVGTIGQITVDRLAFIAELRSRVQELQQSYGWVVGPTCVHTLGDAKCTVDLDAGSPQQYTVTGTLDSVSADGLTFTDSARNEAGPSGEVDIADVTNGNPTVIDLDDALDAADGDIVNITVDEPAAINGPQIVRNISGLRFEVEVDTTGADSFSAGTVKPLSGESGYFAYGWMELLTGDNSSKGIKREVKWSDGATWQLQQAFPFAVAGTEQYRLVAGCDKLEATCRVKFDNLLNFLGFRAKGSDWQQQIGRSE